MMNRIKSFISKFRKKIAAVSVAAVSSVVMAVAASAEEAGASDVGEQIISQFTKAAGDVKPIIVGVLGAGLSLFIVFISIRLGKKMFNTVSK